jgi:hypothetical protein
VTQQQIAQPQLHLLPGLVGWHPSTHGTRPDAAHQQLQKIDKVAAIVVAQRAAALPVGPLFQSPPMNRQ